MREFFGRVNELLSVLAAIFKTSEREPIKANAAIFSGTSLRVACTTR